MLYLFNILDSQKKITMNGLFGRKQFFVPKDLKGLFKMVITQPQEESELNHMEKDWKVRKNK